MWHHHASRVTPLAVFSNGYLNTWAHYSTPISCWGLWWNTMGHQPHYLGFCSSSLEKTHQTVCRQNIVPALCNQRHVAPRFKFKFILAQMFSCHKILIQKQSFCPSIDYRFTPCKPNSCILWGSSLSSFSCGESKSHLWQVLPDAVLVKVVPLKSSPVTLILHSGRDKSPVRSLLFE